jgi:hypothetical protein
MKPIEQARADLNAAQAADPGWEKFEFVLRTGIRLKQVMVAKGLTLAKTKCPKCNGAEALHGRLVTGLAAGRRGRSGGAFRMWCDACPDIRMME